MRQHVGRALAAAAWLACLPGCAYLRHRGEDAAEIVDLGATWAKSPYVSANACLLGLASVGAGKVDGRFVGLGDGRAAAMRHFHRNVGLLVWSYDELGWGEGVDPEKPETLERYHIGPWGWLKYPERRPAYAFG